MRHLSRGQALGALTLSSMIILSVGGIATTAYAQAAEQPTKTGAMVPTVGKTPGVGDTAADFTLESLAGDKVKLSSETSKGPVVLVVLRGFPGYQCPLCTVQVGRLISDAPRFAAAKAKVILVYPGPAESLKMRADEFVKGKMLPKNFTVLLDLDYKFTNQYGLRWEAPNETAYPSTFVMGPTRKVTFAKVSRSHGDRANNADIIKALPTPKTGTGSKMSPS
ncbi:MAG: peroxiredoxin family protein [Armatimonadota bacterium]